MSKNLKTINGLKESDNSTVSTPMYDDLELFTTSFFGGTNRGICIQLLISHNSDIIQLTKKEALKLAKTITKAYKN